MKIKSQSAAPVPPEHQWFTLTPSPDVPILGWVAGPVFGVHCHSVNKASKPCLLKITSGEVPCPWCGVLPVRLIGYQPLYERVSLRRLVTVVSKTMLPVCEQLPHLAHIKLTMPKIQGLPMRVALESDLGTHSGNRRKIEGEPPADIRSYLIHVLWKVQALTDWCRS